MLIFLIGMPAAGKSSLGKALAKSLDFAFEDMDRQITEQEKMKVSDIFDTKGEEYFRLAEKNVLYQTFDWQRTVIATGGGAPCFFDNISQMNQKGLTIYLDVPIEELVRRIIQDKENKRPLFSQKNPIDLAYQLQKLQEYRKNFYLQAKLHWRF